MSKEKQCKCCKEYWWEMNIHSQSGLCPNCYDYVSDLETKLAEKDLRIEELEGQFGYECECNAQFVACQKENEQLKQQLAEKEKEIKELICDYESRITKEQELMSWLEHKCEENDQAKKDFVIEQLKKVKNRIQEDFDYDDLMYWLNKQIKELKEKTNENR